MHQHENGSFYLRNKQNDPLSNTSFLKPKY